MRRLIIPVTVATTLTSCAALMKKPQVRYKYVKVPNKNVKSRQDRIIDCVDKYRGEGLNSAYKICRDLYTIEESSSGKL